MTSLLNRFALIGAVVAMLSGCGGEDSSPDGSLPVVSNVVVTGADTDATRAITFDLADADGDAMSVTVEFRGGSQTSWVAADIVEALTGLTEAGSPHTLTWNVEADVVGEEAADFVIRITPNDGMANGAPGMSPAFEVDRNEPPSASNVSWFSGSSGDISLTYDLADAEGDLASIVVEYMGGSVGGTWTDATVPGQTTGLTPATGRTVVWASAADENEQSSVDYQIRITASDADVGLASTPSAQFSVDNLLENPPTTVVLGTTGSSGDVSIDFSLEDDEDDVCSVTLQYRGGKAGTTWTAASATGVLTGLVPSAGPFSLTWASATDVDGQDADDFQVRVLPYDGTATGSATPSDPFAVDNNEPPTAIELDRDDIDENQAVGTPVGNLSSMDTDPADTHSYALVSGEGDTDNASFLINGDVLETAVVLDFEVGTPLSVRVQSTDSSNQVYANALAITVNDANDAPSFILGADPVIFEDSGPQVVAGWATNISGGPGVDVGQVVAFSITNNTNPDLFQTAPTVAGTTGELGYTCALNTFGVATLTLVAVDDGATGDGNVNTSAPQSFTITVNPVNDEPSFTAADPAAVNEDSGSTSLTGWVTAFNPGNPQEAAQGALAYLVSNVSNPGLFAAAPAVSTAGTLTFTPAADAFGTSTFDLTVQDDGGTANGGDDTSPSQTFTITVHSANDAPSFTASNPAPVVEDAGPQTVPGWVTSFVPGTPDEVGQSVLAYAVSNVSNLALFAAGPTVAVDGTLTFTPAPNAFGTSAFDVSVQDDGGTAQGGNDTSAPQSFTISVTSVNDVPVVTNVTTTGASGDVTVTYDLADIETETCSVTVEYIGGSAADWTAADVAGSAITGLTPGLGKTVTWHSFNQESGQTASNYQIRITATDNDPGLPAESAIFSLDNNRPDLVGAIESYSTQLYVGQVQQVDVAITNSGLVSAAAGHTCKLYFSDDNTLGAGDTELAVWLPDGIVPSATVWHSFTFTVPDHQTAQYLIFTVDEGGAIAEIYEANNDAVEGTITVSPATSLTNYQARGTTVTPALGETPAVRPGGSINVGASLAETGSVAGGSHTIKTYLSDDMRITHSDTLVGSKAEGGLMADQLSTATVSLTVDGSQAPGSYWVGSHHDALDEIDEADETDNADDDQTGVARLDVLPSVLTAGQFDLAAGSARAELQSSTVAPSTVIRFHGDVRNLGDPNFGGSFDVQIYRSDDPTVDLSDTPIGTPKSFTAEQLAADPTFELDLTMPAAPGTYYLAASVDNGGAIAETNENNNLSSPVQTITVAAVTPEVDLVAEAVDDPMPLQVRVSVPFFARYRFRVDGNTSVPATPFLVRFYITTDGVIDGAGDTQVGEATINPTVALGARIGEKDGEGWVLCVVPGATAGAYSFGFIIDAGAAIAEAPSPGAEQNNAAQAASPLNLVSSGVQSNLYCLIHDAVETGGVEPTLYVQDGANFTGLAPSAGNLGPFPSSASVAINYYLTPDKSVGTPGTDTLVGATVISTQTITGQFVDDVPAPNLTFNPAGGPGTYWLYAKIDPANNESEIDESNNDSATVILGGVQRGVWIRVEVLAAAPSPDLAAVPQSGGGQHNGAGVDLTGWTDGAVFNNALGVDAPASAVSIWISDNANASIEAGDVYLGSRAIGSLPGGSGQYVEWNGVLPSTLTIGDTYYYKFVTDALGEIAEQGPDGENNNVAVGEGFTLPAN